MTRAHRSRRLRAKLGPRRGALELGNVPEPEGLREFIETRRITDHWGQRETVTPQLWPGAFGNGRQLLVLQPLNTRPNFYVLRVDSRVVLDDGDSPFSIWQFLT